MTTIKELRQAAGMTQKEFSDFFSIPSRTVEAWDMGERQPPQYVMELIKYKLEKERMVEKWIEWDGYDILIDGNDRVIRCVKTEQGHRTTAWPYKKTKDGWENSTGVKIATLKKGIKDGRYKIL